MRHVEPRGECVVDLWGGSRNRAGEPWLRDTMAPSFSTTKGVASTLVHMMVDRGLLDYADRVADHWPEFAQAGKQDITLRHVLNMSSGLYTVDSRGMEYAIGSGLAYWAGASAINGARNRALMREPGTFWDYENYDTLLGVYAMTLAIGDAQEYLEFPRKKLLDKIGMRSTLLSTDRFGDFILSSFH